MEVKPLLSIIIPTKDRTYYASKAVAEILSISDDRVQVVVQDNGSNQTLERELNDYLNDKRLKYNYTEQTLSFVDNFNHAIDIADGEYVLIIGDDDGITSRLVDVVQFAKDNDIQAIRPSLNAVYFWPNSNVKENSKNGYLYLTKMSKAIEYCSTHHSVVQLLKQGGLNYLNLDLAKLYHGIVRKDLLEQVKNVTGKYIGGLTPDIYASVALSLNVERMLKVNLPLTISGICHKSGSADSATGKHTGRLEDAPHFKGHSNYKWSGEVPHFYSVETIWADSALAAVRDLEPELLTHFNQNALALECLIKYPSFSDFIETSGVDLKKKNDFVLFIMKSHRKIMTFSLKAINRIKSRRLIFHEVNDIIEANRLVDIELKRNGFDNEALIYILNNSLESNQE